MKKIQKNGLKPTANVNWGKFFLVKARCLMLYEIFSEKWTILLAAKNAQLV